MEWAKVPVDKGQHVGIEIRDDGHQFIFGLQMGGENRGRLGGRGVVGGKETARGATGRGQQGKKQVRHGHHYNNIEVCVGSAQLKIIFKKVGAFIKMRFVERVIVENVHKIPIPPT